MARFDTKTLNPGDDCFVCHPARGCAEPAMFKRRVAKVTPSGQVVLESHGTAIPARRFDAKGEEMGAGSKWFRPHLVSKETYDAHKARHVRRDAENLMRSQLRTAANGPLSTLRDTLHGILEQLDTYERTAG